MDKQFQIISDSSCDLPPELAREKISGWFLFMYLLMTRHI